MADKVRTAEEMIAGGDLAHEAIGSWSALEGGLRHASCPTCGAAKPLFAIAEHPTLTLACDWCRIDADRIDQPPSEAELRLHIALERERRLNDSMWSTAADGTVSPDEAAAWATYRAAVAAISPATITDPRAMAWPNPPPRS